MIFLLYILDLVLADEMKWIDYSANSEYDWDNLQSSNPYTYEIGQNIVKFTIGAELEETCGGQYASAIKFSKVGADCEILGHHQIDYVTSFTIEGMQAIGLYYEGGSLCRDPLWGDVKRRIEFKLVCSDKESDFYILNSLKECTTIFEKFTPAGCPQEIQYSLTAKLIFFFFYGILGIILIWLCVEACQEESGNIVSPSGNWKVRKIYDYGKTQVLAISGKSTYTSV
ncbi:hypothetical protein SteCoe_3452 [Stentor coeruleus]|uniref:MRH domain-containing protein n=1 Tax=Stentor coeruleus TaxID=5963 RepID=A0A1R2CX88_9CILI|nr:hypothetical protein SteCoe_3452 [Stentor coeruleus]